MIINVSNNGKVLKDSPQIKTPDFVIITGENGSGKTQLLDRIFGYHENIALSYNVQKFCKIKDENIQATLFDDDQNPFNNIVLASPGIDVLEETPVVKIKHYGNEPKSTWIIAKSMFLIRNSPSLNDQEVANKLSEAIAEYTSILNEGNPQHPNISADDIKLARETADYLHKNVYDINEVDVLITLKPGGGLFSPNINTLFHQQMLLEKHYNEIAKARPNPISIYNQLLVEMEFNYEASYSLNDNDLDVGEVFFLNRKTGERVEQHGFSSGEKTILNLVLSLFSAKFNNFPQIILFDEPDAHLHPSLTKKFLDAIKRILINTHNVRVVMTTHSPSTVAMADQDSIYIMRKGVGYPEKTTREEALKLLTDGLVLVNKYAKFVIVEDETDRDFYTQQFKNMVRQDLLAGDPPLIFIPASKSGKEGGVKAVRAWVNIQKEFDSPSVVMGLTDKDFSNPNDAGISTIERYSLENYFIDPILIYAALMDNGNHKHLEGIDLNMGDQNKIKYLNSDQLQSISEHISDILMDPAKQIFKEKIDNFDGLQQQYDQYLGTEIATSIIHYTNGTQIVVPSWFITMPGKTIMGEICTKTFGGPNVNKNLLTKAMGIVGLIPLDLMNTFKKIQHQ